MSSSCKINDDSIIIDVLHTSIPDSRRRSANNDAGIESNNEQKGKEQQSNSIVVDDPCWGGPDATQHSLEHLLTIINEKNGHNNNNRRHHRDDIDNRRVPPHKLILHECSSYIALYKPPDLRMDGPHPATVHKLLSFWYPPPSIRCSNNNSNSSPSLINSDDDSLLLSRIRPLSKHNDLPDNQLRPCHQLDYATSGVLLVARSHKAASEACHAFQQRRASKEYVALVYGHVDVGRLPTVSRERLEFLWQETRKKNTGGMVERMYKRGRRRRQQQQLRQRGDGTTTTTTTFVGYLPSHSVFAKWKSRHRAKVSTKQHVVKEDDHWEILTLPPSITADETNAILKIRWSDIKQNHPRWKSIFDDMAHRYNTAVKNQQDLQKQNNTTTTANTTAAAAAASPPQPEPQLPRLFRVDNDPPDTFYVNASLASLPHCFQMTLEPHVIDDDLAPHIDAAHYRSFLDGCDTATLDFKPALTRVTVSWRGRCRLFQNNATRVVAVSKVTLYPHTGRRHQLRCHMLLVGHVIVGDVAYEPPSSSSSTMESVTCYSPDEAVMNRMCLHARRLTLAIRGDERIMTEDDDAGEQSLTFTAPDPFRVNEESGYVEIVGPELWGKCDFAESDNCC